MGNGPHHWGNGPKPYGKAKRAKTRATGNSKGCAVTALALAGGLAAATGGAVWGAIETVKAVIS